MSDSDRRLVEQCRSLGVSASDALAWFGTNADKVGQDRASLERKFRKVAVTAQRLAQAAERPMCVGVFGPSQVGKSYLISALARSGTAPLVAEFDGVPEGHDFVRDINPEGGEESTGLVTRFTMKRQQTPPGFPVVLRLLSETDIVKILTNTYLSDLDRTDEPELTVEEIQQAFERARKSAQSSPVDTLTVDDIYDLREYLDKYFKTVSPLAGPLASSYWRELEKLAPLLPDGERARLFSFLWGKHEPFTKIYAEMYAALKALGFPGEAYAEMAALSPGTRVDSIIDVRTLFKLGSGTDGTVKVKGLAGGEANLPRAALTALVAELRIVVREKPWDFFDHTDLLDFPGARSRENDRPDKIFKKEDGVANLFLRGKVAYLYERYCAELELTSMLLCVAPSNQEVRVLPKLVNDWIELTHGATSQARAAQETALFVVLTKFDMQFEEKAGEGDPSQRFTTRMNVSLTEFFGRTHEWVGEWQPGRPFTNCFWMRNPNFLAKSLLRYDKAGKELGLLESEVDRIGDFRDAHMGNDLIQKHFSDPERAWEEAFRLNDGGITYLAESLAPVCNPDIKRRQVLARFEEQRAEALEALSRFHVSGDKEEERIKRRGQAIETLKELQRCVKRDQFGQFISQLTASERALADLYFRIANDTGAEDSAEPIPEQADDDDDLLGDILQDDEVRTEITAGPSAPRTPRDRAAIYAEQVVATWIEDMRSFSENQAGLQRLQISPAAMGNIVSELSEGERRLKIGGRVASRVREMNEYRQTPKQAKWKSAMVAAVELNRFINDLGFGDVPLDKRPTVGRSEESRRPIFAPRQPFSGLPPLGDSPADVDRTFAQDWMAAFIKFVEDNAVGEDGQQVNDEQNIALGALIGRIKGDHEVREST